MEKIIYLEKEVSAKRNLNRFSGFDGMRAIACLLVIGHHMFQTLSRDIIYGNMKEVHGFFAFVANAGTSIFFVLSGFLLSYPFWNKYLENGNFPSIKDYIIKRAARIVPGFYISVIVSTIVVLVLKVEAPYLWQRTLSALTFTSEFHYVTLFPSEVNGALWSIGFEVFWYILLPIFMFGLYKLGKKRSFSKAMGYWLGVMIFIIFANSFVHQYLTPEEVNRGWQFGMIGGAKYWMPNYNPVGLFTQFSMGIIAAGITTQLYRYSQKIEKLKKVFLFDVISFLAFVGGFLVLWNLRYAPEFSYSIQHQPYFFPLFQIFIAITMFTLPHTIIFGKILDNGFFKYTSKVSFGLYIWHHLIIAVVVRTVVPEYFYGGMYNFTEWVKVSLAILVVAYIIASISYFVVEKPILDRVHKKSK